MVACSTGIGVQPNCCGRPTQPCSRCLGGKAPLYWEVTLSGLLDKVPTNCPACLRYNSAVFTLSPATGEDCLPLSGYAGITDATPCCWRCFVNPNSMSCLFSQAPGVIDLLVAETGGDYYINVFVGDREANREVYFRKQYATLPDCRNLVAETIPWHSNAVSGRCAGDALASCSITAKTSIVDPCCRDICYPDETPGPVTIVVAGLGAGDCAACAALNGAYVLTRSDRSGVGCWRARFPEVCGMNAITVDFGPGGEVMFYNADTWPFGTALVFNLMHYTFSTPFANCNQYNGIEYRTLGDGLCSVPGIGYATATATF